MVGDGISFLLLCTPPTANYAPCLSLNLCKLLSLACAFAIYAFLLHKKVINIVIQDIFKGKSKKTDNQRMVEYTFQHAKDIILPSSLNTERAK